MMQQALFGVALTTLVVLGVNRTEAAIVTISNNNVVASAYDYTGGSDSLAFSGTATTASTSLHAEINGNSSDVNINYTTSGGQTIFDNQFDFVRTGDRHDYARNYESSMFFTVDANTTYDLSGNFDVTDVGDGDSGRVFLQSFLLDQTASTDLFYNYQDSRSTHDETFTLGNTDGDYTNHLLGSMTGNLQAGHTYQWYFFSIIHAYTDSDSGASATGSMTLTIGESAAVPEPTSCFTFLGLISCFGLAGWRKRRLQAA